MYGILRIFFGAEGTRPSIVLGCLVLAGFAEAVGLTTMLPIVTKLVDGVDATTSSPSSAMVLDTLAAVGLSPTIETLMTVVVIGMTAKALLSFAALSYVGYSVANVATGLRTSLIRQLMDARWSYFTDQKVGQIANSISNDATRAGKAYMTAAKFVSFLVQGMVYAIVAIALSWKLALVGLGIGAVMTLSLNFLVRMSKQAGRKQTFRTSDLVTYLTDTLNNIKPLKAMGRQSVFFSLLNTKVTSLKKALRRQVVATQARIYAEEILLTVCLTVGVYITAVMWKVPLAEMVVMGIIFYQVISIVGKMQRNLQTAVEVESAYWAVKDLIADTSVQFEPNPGTRTPTLAKGCRFDAVGFAYPGQPVLHRVTFDIPARSITVLKGASGAGKTTIVDLLIGLHRPQTGSILVDGVSLADIDVNAWRRRIGYVPQDPTLFHDTIRENITLGDTDCGDADIEHALESAGALGFVTELPEGLDTVVGERGTKFSGGQRQRIALARALVARPDLLILDEVTSALDPTSEREICRNIQDLSDRYTILAITHRPAWIDIATSLYEVVDGHVSPAATPHAAAKALA
jgi:ATP-binding cassette subfamily C protein